MQQTVHARTPLSLCCKRLWCASDSATGMSESLCASSWSIARSSSSSAFSRVKRSLTPTCLPGFPTSGCFTIEYVNFLRPSCTSSSCSCSRSSSSTTSVAAAALRLLRGAMSRGCACRSACLDDDAEFRNGNDRTRGKAIEGARRGVD
jgi:hypothetical protein